MLAENNSSPAAVENERAFCFSLSFFFLRSKLFVTCFQRFTSSVGGNERRADADGGRWENADMTLYSQPTSRVLNRAVWFAVT